MLCVLSDCLLRELESFAERKFVSFQGMCRLLVVWPAPRSCVRVYWETIRRSVLHGRVQGGLSCPPEATSPIIAI